MKIKSISLLSGVALGSLYGGIVIFTTLLKGTSLATLFFNSGIVLAPVGAVILWLMESIGLVSEPGMAGGILILAYGSYVLWVVLFSFLSFFVISKYRASNNH